MNVNVHKDPANATMTMDFELAATVERAWQLFADPRQLERWWGPPTYPATVVHHDFRPGGEVHYYMTGPEGDKPAGLWRVLKVDEPGYLEVEELFADADFNPHPDLPPMNMRVRLEAVEVGTRVTVTSKFPSPEAMAEVLEMGIDEGMRQAIGQIEAVLADD